MQCINRPSGSRPSTDAEEAWHHQTTGHSVSHGKIEQHCTECESFLTFRIRLRQLVDPGTDGVNERSPRYGYGSQSTDHRRWVYRERRGHGRSAAAHPSIATHRPIRDLRRTRPRQFRRRVLRSRSHDAAGRGHQVCLRSDDRWTGEQAGIPAQGANRGRAAAPESGGRFRFRRERGWAAVHRVRICRGQFDEPAHCPGQLALPGHRMGGRRGRCPARGPQAAHRPSRHQAGQHPHRRAAVATTDRFRSGQGQNDQFFIDDRRLLGTCST